MAKDYIPQGDREFLAWAQNFLTVATEFQQELGLTDEQMQDIADAIAAFNNDLGLAESIHQQSVAATRQKNISRDVNESLLRRISQQAKLKPGLPETILIGLGLRANDTQPTRRHPVQPDDLVAEMKRPGVVHLDWDSGGNTAGVQYVIEYQEGDKGEWTLLDIITRRNYDHENVPTGVRITYRVRARRNGETSPPSNEASIKL